MKIALVGYGKMGRAIDAVATDAGHQIVAKIDHTSQLDSIVSLSPDVAIEFSQPEVAFDNIYFLVDNQIPVVTGTTGWLDKLPSIIDLVKEKQGTFLYASNFSIGVNLFFQMNEWLAKSMRKLSFSPQIEEVHHTEKLDSPSGTAITLAQKIIEYSDRLDDWTNEHTSDQTKLEIISKRLPNIPGTHTVTYSSPLETISIQHIAHDRSVFAEGVVKVTEWINGKKGVFKMSDFLNDVQ